MLYIHNGGCRHAYALEPSQVPVLIKYNFISQAFGIVAPALGKISVGLLLVRIMGPNYRWRKWSLYGGLAVYGIFSAILVIITYVQCRPTSALWEKNPEAKCWDPKVFSDIAIAQSCKISRLACLHFSDSKQLVEHSWILCLHFFLLLLQEI
jgi:hypothetical protein